MALLLTDKSDKGIAGLLIMLVTISSIISSMFGGYISDVFNRKRSLLLGIIFNGIFLILLGISLLEHPDNIYIIALLYLLNSLSFSFYTPILSSMLIDYTTDKNRQHVFSYDYWLVNLAMAIGFLIGGIFFLNYSYLLFLISGIITLLAGIIYSIYLKDNLDTSKKTKNIYSTYKLPLKDYKFIFFVVSGSFIFSCEIALTNFIAVHIYENFKAFTLFKFTIDGVSMVSLIRTINTTLVLTLTLLINKITSKYSSFKLLLIGLLLYILSYTSMHIVLSPIALFILIILATIGEIIFAPIYQTEAANLMPKGHRGSYSAIANIGVQLSAVIASLMLSLSDFISVFSTYAIVLILSLNSLVITIYIVKKNGRST